MSDDCLFCQIVDGEVPSYTVYEDDETLAFLDVNPVSAGHTLVIPKRHAEHLTGMDERTTEAVFQTVNKVASAVETGLEPDGINLLQNNGKAAGQEIDHVHVHVIPRFEGDGFQFAFDSKELEEDIAEDLVDAISGVLDG